MADFPRLLNLGEKVENNLRFWLDNELINHRAERSMFLQQLMEWQDIYWAKPSEAKKTFPFDGACNLIIPLTAISVETVHSKFMTTLFGMPQIISAKAKTADWVPTERDFEQWYDDELQKNLGIYSFCDDTDLENVKFGNCIGKSGYRKVVKTAIREDDQGEDQEIEVTVEDNATLEPVALSRFLMPYSFTNPQKAPWCGEEHSTAPTIVLEMEQNGFFIKGTYDKLKSWVNQLNGSLISGGREVQANQEKLELKDPQWPKFVDWVEIWASFDVDGEYVGVIDPNSSKSNLREIVVYYHVESRTIMGVRYNWNEDLRRPYRIGKYFPIEHRWTGIGICKQNDEFQKEVTIQHRQRIDNATLANTRMFKVNRMSGYGPGESIFPGKLWFLDEMDHLEPIEFGDVYTSSFNNEQATLVYSQQRVGVNSMTLGQDEGGTPGTATSDLAKLQEARGKSDYHLKNYKKFLNEIILDAACNIHQFGPRNLQITDLNPSAGMINKFFTLPEKYIRDGIAIDIKTIGQSDNKLIDRQSWMQIAQLLQQYYTAQLDLAKELGDQQLTQQILSQALLASTEAMRQVLESYEVRNIQRILVATELQTGDNSQNQNQQPNQSPLSLFANASGQNGLIPIGSAPGGSSILGGFGPQPGMGNIAPPIR